MSTPPSSKSFPKTYKLSDLGLDLDGTRPAIDHEDEDDEPDFSPSSSAEKVAMSLLRTPDNTQGRRRAVEFDFEDDDIQFWQVRFVLICGYLSPLTDSFSRVPQLLLPPEVISFGRLHLA
jgi:hypothetical protein